MAATELGDHTSLCPATFYQDYGELLREIWDEVPVVWEGGRLQLGGVPKDHSCAP